MSLPPDLPVPEDDGAADHLAGVKSPGLTLISTAGEAIHLDALGDGRSVIYIYPRTGRPGTDLPHGWDAIPGARGCTPESCSFRDHYQELLDAGVGRVFGLSSQDSDYQREVVERLQLPFQMLSDPTLSLAAAVGRPDLGRRRCDVGGVGSATEGQVQVGHDRCLCTRRHQVCGATVRGRAGEP